MRHSTKSTSGGRLAGKFAIGYSYAGSSRVAVCETIHIALALRASSQSFVLQHRL